MNEPISRLIKVFGLAELAKKFGVTYVSIRNWENEGVPPKRVLEVYWLCTKTLKNPPSPFDINSEIYPDPNWVPAISSQPQATNAQST